MPIAGIRTSPAALHRRSRPTSPRPGIPGAERHARYQPASPTRRRPALTRAPVNSWTRIHPELGDIQAGDRVPGPGGLRVFNDGGTRCWVTRIGTAGDDLTKALRSGKHRRGDHRRRAAAARHHRPGAQRGAEALVTHSEAPKTGSPSWTAGRDIADDNLVISADADRHRRPAAANPSAMAPCFSWILVADPAGPARQPGGGAAKRPRGQPSTPAASPERRGPPSAPPTRSSWERSTCSTR